jgi:hypothetical protein
VPRPNGLLLVNVPNLWNADRLIRITRSRDFTVTLMEGHVRGCSPQQLRRLLTEQFAIVSRVSVGFGWTGRDGGPIERLLELRSFGRFCKSIAMGARRYYISGTPAHCIAGI